MQVVHANYPFFKAEREARTGVIYVTHEPAVQFDRVGRMQTYKPIQERFKLACEGYLALYGHRANNDIIK
jgi:hypothetical protein